MPRAAAHAPRVVASVVGAHMRVAAALQHNEHLGQVGKAEHVLVQISPQREADLQREMPVVMSAACGAVGTSRAARVPEAIGCVFQVTTGPWARSSSPGMCMNEASIPFGSFGPQPAEMDSTRQAAKAQVKTGLTAFIRSDPFLF